MSALSMLELADGDRASYPEIADTLVQYGAQPTIDLRELYARMVVNLLISNVDDHLRNHGFLRHETNGWSLAPAFDLNPTPQDVRERFLTTTITLDGDASGIDALLSVAEYFGLAQAAARHIVCHIASIVCTWRTFAEQRGASAKEIRRMSSAFEHDDLTTALALG